MSTRIRRTQLKTGSNDHVLINDETGRFSSEAQLAYSRGGTGIGSNYGISWKTIAKVATTSSLADLYYPPVSYVATSTTITSGITGAFPTIDGVTVNTGDTVLVKNETSSNEPNNGIYTLTSPGDVYTNWVLTRRVDANNGNNLLGAEIIISQGTINKAKSFRQLTVGTITLGSSNISFTDNGVRYASYFSGSNIGAKINAAIASFTSNKPGIIIVNPDDWNGASYSTQILCDKEVHIIFPTRTNPAVYTGTEASLKITSPRVHITSFNVSHSGNGNSNVDGILISGQSNCIFDGGMDIISAVRHGIHIDAVNSGAYNNTFVGLIRIESQGGDGILLTSSGSGRCNANSFNGVSLVNIPNTFSGINIVKGYANSFNNVFADSAGATAWAVSQSDASAFSYFSNLTIDTAVEQGVQITDGTVVVSGLKNNASITAETISGTGQLTKQEYSGDFTTPGNIIVSGTTGKVGVRKAVPIYVLDVNGDLQIKATASGSASFRALGSNGNRNIDFGSFNADNGAVRIFQSNGTTEPVRFSADTVVPNSWVGVSNSGKFGIGTSSPTSTLHNSGSIALTYTTKASTFTPSATEYGFLVDATSGSVTANLPTAVGITGRKYFFKKTDSSSNTVIVNPSTTETVDGKLTFSLSFQNETVEVISDGANWAVETPDSNSIVHDVTQTSHGFIVGNAIYNSGLPYSKTKADSFNTTEKFVGIVSEVIDADNFKYISSGEIVLTTAQWDAVITGTYPSGLIPGFNYALDDATAGFLTISPTSLYTKYVLRAITTTKAIVIHETLVTEEKIFLSDVTTNNVSTSRHGLTPKLPNNANVFLDGTGNYSTPSGSSVAAFPPGHIYGLTLSNSGGDPTNDLDIAAGSARDVANVYDMTLASSITKQLDANWAVGTNQGGLDTGSVGDGTYHVFLIRRSDTEVVDVLFSLSPTSPTMPANYNSKRRIGSFIRQGAIQLFKQIGDEFLLDTPYLEINDTNPGTSAVTATFVTIPTGIIVHAFVNAGFADNANNNGLYISPLSISDTAPSDTVAPLKSIGAGNAANTIAAQMHVRTDTNAQFRYRVVASTGATTVKIVSLGWIDRRGKDGDT